MDKYTKYTIENGLSRRSFLSRAMVASCAGLVGFSGCKPNSPSPETFEKENHQCLDADGNPINGLYAVGNLGGGFYGGVDYPLIVYGLSLGRCYTFGYLVGRHVAKLEPSA